jgi:CheY-like chemotaxis protein
MFGNEVVSAADGTSGIERAIEFQPDVCFIDVGLPEMSGYEVARRLRADERSRDLYLVALTGYSSPEHTNEAKNAGFDVHLVKPVEPRMLERLIRERVPEARHPPLTNANV